MMASFSSALSMQNTNNDTSTSTSMSRVSLGANDKLKKLQLTKKEATVSFMQKEISSSKLINISAGGIGGGTGGGTNGNGNISLNNGISTNNTNGNGTNGNDLNTSSLDPDYEEIVVTIRKSERGFGFELKNGVLVVNVFPNTPAFFSGIQVGDMILKVNGTCVKSKEQNEINNMIHESNSFVSLTLQRKLSFTNPSSSLSSTSSARLQPQQQLKTDNENDEKIQFINNFTNDLLSANTNNNDKQTLKNVTNQLSISNNSSLFNNVNRSNSRIDISDDNLINNNNNNNNNDYDIDYDDDTNDENNSNSINNNMTIASSADQSTSKISEFINNMNDTQDFLMNDTNVNTTLNTNNNLHPPLSRNSSSNASSNRRAIKKTRSSNNSKTFQTQSLSNIAITTLNHSASDNDLDQQSKQQSITVDLDDNDLLDYKDDLSYTSEDNLHEPNSDKTTILRLLGNLWTNTQLSIRQKQEDKKQDHDEYEINKELDSINNLNALFDMSGYNDYSQLVTKPVNLSILLRYILSTENESPKNLYFCIFTDDLLSSNEKKEVIVRWAYELYTTFLENNAPLKLKVNEMNCKKIEDIFDRNPVDNLNQLKKLFEEVKQEAVEIVNMQLGRFREVKQMGLANLFHNSDLQKLSQMHKYDFDTIKPTIVESLSVQISELGREITKLNNEWNGSHDTAHLSALISSFATFAKRLGLPIKQIGKYDLDKIPMFVNKKLKLKKTSSSSARNHCFIDCPFLTVRSICSKCNYPFWGIGFQGLICQKNKCELKIHRHCLSSGVPTECHGIQKTIKTDYKGKLEKMLFGGLKTKPKDEEPIVPMETNTSTVKSIFYAPSFDSQTSLGSTGEPSVLNPYPSDYDQIGNLPVELAIKKFESLTAKKNPSLINSPTSNSNGSNGKVNQSNSGSSSPTNSSNVHRHHSISSNNHSPTGGDSLTNLKKDNHNNSNQHYQQILPNKPNNQINNNSNTSSRDQACKRVGSLKVDVKKPKSNVTRSKSDPEPDEIKHVITSVQSNNKYTDRFSIDSSSLTLTDQNESINSNNHASSYRIPASPGTLSTNQTPNLYGYTTSSSSLSNNNNNNNNSARQSWMNESDMEVDEELPSINIDRQKLEQLDKKEIKTQEVINELIHTEQKHVRNLKIMKHHFYIPIKVNMYLTNEERDILFPNLEEVLEIHSNFNNKLKKLRKENTVVPVKQLINIILEQFKGEQGEKFQTACAKFCENQSQAMKLLQMKLKNNDKFSQFINNAENHSICRKLQLKDFIPTEVQRLVKYRLLFNELNKNVTDKDDANKLQECVEASCKISSFVNKAVTECENRKRSEEIQSRIDTKEFDQYCTKSPLLTEYRSLDLRTRKLVYESELEWKINHTNKILIALLYEDILVLLERSTDEKRRYILKPLTYVQNKTKQTFTPVIPLVWIESFRPMTEKRQFHLVAIIKEKNNKEHHRESAIPFKQSSQIQNQMLFIFVAKSGDERNKWCTYLNELTGRMSQPEKQSGLIDLTLNRQQSSTSSLSHSSSNTAISSSLSSSSQNSSSIASSINALNPSISSSTLNNQIQFTPLNANLNEPVTPTNQSSNHLGNNNNYSNEEKSNSKQNVSKDSDYVGKEINSEEQLKLQEQLNENSKSIIDLLKQRQLILNRLNGCNTNFELDYDEEDEDLLIQNENRSQILANNVTNALNSLIQTVISQDIEKMNRTSTMANNESKLVKNVMKLEKYFNSLRSGLNQMQQERNKKESQTICLPNLKLSATTTTTNPADTSILIESSNNIGIVNRNPVRNVCQIVKSDANSELVSSSIISSSSNNADLSEDEQINYYDEDNLNNEQPISLQSINGPGQNNPNIRSLSTSSDQTLVVMPNNLIITESVNFNPPSSSQKNHKNLDADDEDEAKEMFINKTKRAIYGRTYNEYFDDEEDDVQTNSDLMNEDEQEEDEYRTPENEQDDKSSTESSPNRNIDKSSEAIRKNFYQNLIDKTSNKESDLISIHIKPNNNNNNEIDADLELDFRVPTPPNSEPPSLPLNSYSTDSANVNDLSDDEVKEYHVFKESYDDNYDQSNA